MAKKEPANKPEQSKGQWKPGQSGNPNGRPSGYAEFKEKCRARTDEAIAALVVALDGEQSVSAARVLLEFGWGKPTQAVELSGADGSALQVVIQQLPPEKT